MPRWRPSRNRTRTIRPCVEDIQSSDFGDDLSPTGHRAYTLVQKGRKISFVQSIDRPLPFSPKNILIDLHRIFFRGIEPRPSSDGVYSTQQEGELIVEVYKNKKLEKRRYKRLDARPKGWIRVRYHGGMVDHTPPPRIDFVNGWYGYRLTIKTLAQHTELRGSLSVEETRGDGGKKGKLWSSTRQKLIILINRLFGKPHALLNEPNQ